MRRSKYSPQKIAKILKEFEAGKSVEQISRDYGVSLIGNSSFNVGMRQSSYPLSS